MSDNSLSLLYLLTWFSNRAQVEITELNFYQILFGILSQFLNYFQIWSQIEISVVYFEYCFKSSVGLFMVRTLMRLSYIREKSVTSWGNSNVISHFMYPFRHCISSYLKVQFPILSLLDYIRSHILLIK